MLMGDANKEYNQAKSAIHLSKNYVLKIRTSELDLNLKLYTAELEGSASIFMT